MVSDMSEPIASCPQPVASSLAVCMRSGSMSKDAGWSKSHRERATSRGRGVDRPHAKLEPELRADRGAKH